MHNIENETVQAPELLVLGMNLEQMLLAAGADDASSQVEHVEFVESVMSLEYPGWLSSSSQVTPPYGTSAPSGALFWTNTMRV